MVVITLSSAYCRVSTSDWLRDLDRCSRYLHHRSLASHLKHLHPRNQPSEASEMATFGAKILHPSTLVPALRHQIPVFVGSSKAPELGGT
ncbi:hypothetical protein OK016_11020 [Vibrio chagasii]|nr:hypothetical protein [Vibrio chagasii]